jgi:hypothetical protein
MLSRRQNAVIRSRGLDYTRLDEFVKYLFNACIDTGARGLDGQGREQPRIRNANGQDALPGRELARCLWPGYNKSTQRAIMRSRQ